MNFSLYLAGVYLELSLLRISVYPSRASKKLTRPLHRFGVIFNFFVLPTLLPYVVRL